MMKTPTPAAGLRSTSNSTEASRLKKSSSSGFANKVKPALSTTTTAMNYSIKQTRVNTNSKSNKKANLQSSNSNKSFKALADTSCHTTLESNKKTIPHKPDPAPTPSDKKTTVPVKNMKQKAIGQSLNQPCLANSYKVRTKNTEEKEN
jgi:hypothetical protein